MKSLRCMTSLLPLQLDESKQRVAGSNDDVLHAIKFKRDRTVADAVAKIGMPQRVAGSRIQRNKIIRRIARKHEIPSRAQYAVMTTSAFPFMTPANLACTDIDRLHYSFG